LENVVEDNQKGSWEGIGKYWCESHWLLMSLFLTNQIYKQGNCRYIYMTELRINYG
jgi:hypothetical protein